MSCFRLFFFFFFPAVFLFAQPNDPNITVIQANDTLHDFGSADVVILYDSTVADVKESGLSYVRLHTLTKIVTEKGALNNRHVIFNYDPLSADVTVLRARIYRSDGTVENIDTSTVLDYPAPARMIYWGAREKAVRFGYLKPGDVIETLAFRKGFTYALLRDDDDRFIPPMKGHFYDIVPFWSSVPVLEKVYRLMLPKSKDLQYRVYNGQTESYCIFGPENTERHKVRVNSFAKQYEMDLPEIDTLNFPPGKKVYEWKAENIAPFKSESNMVAASDVAPKLLLSTSPDWYAKSIWFYNVNEDYGSFEVTSEVQKKTDELLEGVNDEDEKISILTHWVAENIRYSGLSMGEGEGYTLHKGEMTFSDRCGVCKDKAGMLVTMLRAAGFESYAAMTMAGSRIDRIPADQFNHSITVVKRSNGDWELLDPTWVPNVRELWSSAEQQQEYLLGIPGGADLMTTPISPPENHYWKLTGESTLSDDGILEGTLTLVAEGQSDALIRRIFSGKSMSAWEEYPVEALTKLHPHAEILDYAMTDPYDISEPMEIKVSYRIPGYALLADNYVILQPLLAANPFSDRYMSNELTVNTSKESKEYGFRVRCSKLVTIDETINLPESYKAVFIPDFEIADDNYTSFNAGYTMQENKLTFTLTHSIGKRIYESGEWEEFRKAMLERKDVMSSPVIFEKRREQ